MLIAQLTDLHIGFDPAPDELNRGRLDQVIAAVLAGKAKPDVVLVTGDLTDKGDVVSYSRLRDALSAFQVPLHFCVGNHDLRDNLLDIFPKTPVEDGFIQYVVDDFPLRMVFIDTLEDGRHGGGFCERREAWLESRLSESDRPTLLVLHHPPICTGIDWITADPDEPWARRLAGVVSRHPQVVAAICGHVHRPIIAPWANTTLIVCPSVAPQVGLELAPIDVDQPDMRALIVAEDPAYGLHLWRDGALVSHFGFAKAHKVLARYDAKTQPMIREFAAERGT